MRAGVIILFLVSLCFVSIVEAKDKSLDKHSSGLKLNSHILSKKNLRDGTKVKEDDDDTENDEETTTKAGNDDDEVEATTTEAGKEEEDAPTSEAAVAAETTESPSNEATSESDKEDDNTPTSEATEEKMDDEATSETSEESDNEVSPTTVAPNESNSEVSPTTEEAVGDSSEDAPTSEAAEEEDENDEGDDDDEEEEETTASPSSFSPVDVVTDILSSATSAPAAENVVATEPTPAPVQAPPPAKGSAKFKQNIFVDGDIQSTGALFTSLNVLGEAEISVLSSQSIKSPLVTTDNLMATRISSPTGTIILEGNIVLSKDGGTTFLQTNEMKHYGKSKEHHHGWKKVSFDSFNEPKENIEWKDSARTIHTDKFLLGSDVFLSGSSCNLDASVLSKQLKNLPKHSMARVKARVHFIDNWKGESVFFKIDGNIMWLDSAIAAPLEDIEKGRAMNVCGGDHPDPRISVLVEFTTEHTSDLLKIEVGSTLPHGNCIASFGLDDVSISIHS